MTPATQTPAIIRCEEIAVDPILVTLGEIRIDISRISAYNTIRFFKMLQDIAKGTADPDRAGTLILDIAAEQNKHLTPDDILKAGNQKQLEKFIQTVAEYVVKTYQPLQERITPFLADQKKTLK